MDLLNSFFFIALPYIAMLIFLIGTIHNYRVSKFKISSLSSQFLEGRHLFWGSVPFHWGLLFLFFGHLAAFLIPDAVIAWNSQPVRLVILEVTAFIFGLSMLVGLINLLIRRWSNTRIRVVTTKMDIIVEVLILAQVALGLWIAYDYRWGSSWFASTLTPYLWSVFKLNPSIDAVSAMPIWIKFHIIGTYLIILLFPFSRLMHALVAPIDYLWRPYQRVIWYWDRKSVHNPKTKWSVNQPRNT
ncbi:MAG: respiratory nitrate reductase subunit gamma [Bacteroidetes bacterium]|nr:respiratory nitrate reductase subunit gamma [Bacteroidota bacterium]